MAQSDQPASDTSKRAWLSRHRAAVVVGAVLLLGAAAYLVSPQPKYSGDPRLDRAARVLVAYLPNSRANTAAGRLITRWGGGRTLQPKLSPEDSRRVTWMQVSAMVLKRRSQPAQAVPRSAVPPGSDSSSGSSAQGVLPDVGNFRSLWLRCMENLGTDVEQTQILTYALGFPWGLQDPRWGAEPSALYPLSLPLGDAERLERCLRLAGKAAEWKDADRALRDTERLTHDERLYVRAELIRRTLEDPFATEAAYGRAAALLRTHGEFDTEQISDILARLAVQTIADAPPYDRDVVQGVLRRAHPSARGLVDSSIRMPEPSGQ